MALSDITEKAMRDQGWLLASECARMVKKDVRTLYRWIDANKVRGFKESGHRRYINWQDVLDHMGEERCQILGISKDDIWTEHGAQ